MHSPPSAKQGQQCCPSESPAAVEALLGQQRCNARTAELLGRQQWEGRAMGNGSVGCAVELSEEQHPRGGGAEECI